VSDWRLHDLRRTARTGLAALRVDPDISERVIGHVIGGVRGVYDRYLYLDEKREALDRWAQRIGEIVNLPATSVAQLHATGSEGVFLDDSEMLGPNKIGPGRTG